jgi:DNA topoisomerase-1
VEARAGQPDGLGGLERTTVTLREGTGKHELRATGQVVKFPGFLAVYDEGRDAEAGMRTRKTAPAPAMPRAIRRPRRASTPASTSPSRRRAIPKRAWSSGWRNSGIGRPSTYAATIQVLKDRSYVRTEKNRFFAEESGRLLTAFLERFFPRYVGYDFTAGMEDELDEVSGGRGAEWKERA